MQRQADMEYTQNCIAYRPSSSHKQFVGQLRNHRHELFMCRPSSNPPPVHHHHSHLCHAARSAYRTFFYAPSVVVSLSEMGLSLSIYHSHGFLAQSLSLLWLYVCPPQNLFLCSGGSSRMFFAVAQLLLKGWMVVNSRVLCWRLRGHGSFTLSVMYLLNGSVYSPANDVKLRTERSQWHRQLQYYGYAHANNSCSFL